MSRTLGVGIVGCGGISAAHCRAWQKVENARLVAVTDIDPARAAKRAEEFNIPNADPGIKPLLARPEVDIVDIVTPNKFHRPVTIAACRAGKHVICEKPLALTPRDVDAMIAAAEQAGVKLSCIQQMRFEQTSRALGEYLTKRPLGEVYYARARYTRRRRVPTTAGFIYKKNSGGGACIDVGVHVLDLAMHFMGNFEPVSVTGVTVNKLARRPETFSEWNWGLFDKKGMDVEDFAAGFIRFANGAALCLECSFMLNQQPREESRIDLFGTEAGATWPACEIYDHTSQEFTNTKIEFWGEAANGHAAQFREFIKAVNAGGPVPVPPAQSRAVIAVLDGLYRSNRTGREVRIAPV